MTTTLGVSEPLLPTSALSCYWHQADCLEWRWVGCVVPGTWASIVQDFGRVYFFLAICEERRPNLGKIQGLASAEIWPGALITRFPVSLLKGGRKKWLFLAWLGVSWARHSSESQASYWKGERVFEHFYLGVVYNNCVNINIVYLAVFPHFPKLCVSARGFSCTWRFPLARGSWVT